MKYITYTDGSCKEIPGIGLVYGSAYILAPEGSTQWHVCYKAGCDEYSESRNIAGEVFAVMMACSKAIELGDCDTLVIYHDYEGIANWINHKWKKRNTKISKNYYLYMTQQVLPKLKLEFVWVKGHDGVQGNEIVDGLAKRAIDDYVLKNGGVHV